MNRRPTFRLTMRRLVLPAIVVLAVYVLIPQLGDFRTSWEFVQHPQHAGWVVAAFIATMLTYPVAAATYSFLAFRRLSIWRTVLVQLAAMFANRLLPVGAGALGINYLYLRHSGHRTAEAGSVVAMNNLVGFAGHALLVLICLLLPGQSEAAVTSTKWPIGSLLLAAAGIAVVLAVALLWNRLRLLALARNIVLEVRRYRYRLPALGGALASSMILTLCNLLSFACCLLSLDIHVSFISVLLIFTAGVGAGIAAPTPGGLGGFEAGLVAGLVTYDVSPAVALAAALLYRLVSFWLPLLAGGPAIAVAQRRHLFGSPKRPLSES